MEQAVIFGDRPENPLTFDLEGDTAGDVAAAAEAISAEILDCSMSPAERSQEALTTRFSIHACII